MAPIIGTLGNDLLPNLSKADRVFGFPGDDTLQGMEEDDYLQGNQGNDSIEGNQGNDTLHGGQNDDSLSGGEGDDLLFGDKDNDVVFGNQGNDTIEGNEGKDLLLGNQDQDWVYGNQDDDTLYGGQNDDTLSGGDGNDLIFGDKDNDVVFGNQGNDEIEGNEGNDLLLGNQGNDAIEGNQGNDTLYGGQNDDTLYGGEQNDWLLGDKDNDFLSGNEGDDTLDGGEGNDTLYGGANNDSLEGGEGNDLLFGGTGNDILYASSGSDTLSGGEGTDLFILARGTGSFNLSEANVITDFSLDTDVIESIDGLNFEDLNILDGTNENEGSAVIQDNTTGEYLAIFQGVSSSALRTGSSFVNGPTSPAEFGFDIPTEPPTPERQPMELFVVNETTPPGEIGSIASENNNFERYALENITDSSSEAAPGTLAIDSRTGVISLLDPSAFNESDYFDVNIVITNTVTRLTTTQTRRIYKQIQNAIDDAVSGDIIVVGQGTYAENLEINKSLTLKGVRAGIAGNESDRGSAETFLTAPSGAAAIQIMASDVTIDGIETDSDILATQNDTPISNLVIQNVRSLGATDGINIEDAETAIIENNLIEGGSGIVVGLFTSSTSAMIRNNTLKDVNFGIWGSLTDSTIEENSVTAAETISSSDFGIGGAIADTLITNNTVSGYTNGARGINLEANSSNVTIANNTIEASELGIVVEDEVENASVNNNFFTDTTSDLVVTTNAPISPSSSVAISPTQPINIITGSSNDDSLVGGEDNDLLIGGKGKDTLTGGEGMDTFAYTQIDSSAATTDVITDFEFGAEGDAIAITKNITGLSAGTNVVIQNTSSLDGTENLIVDTEANILELTSTSAKVAYATDSGRLFFDKDGDFTVEAIGQVELGSGNLTANNVIFWD